jgi:hypothetical protein
VSKQKPFSESGSSSPRVCRVEKCGSIDIAPSSLKYRAYICRVHAAERTRAYRVANLEKETERKRAYRVANLEKVRARDRAYYEAHGEEVRKRKRVYDEANRDKVREYQRVYRTTIAGVAAQLRSRYGFNIEDSFALARRLTSEHERCWSCGILAHMLRRMKFSFPVGCPATHKTLHVDHVRHDLPRHDLNAVRLSCAFCHYLRGAGDNSHRALSKVVAFWEDLRRPRDLYWLHTAIDPVTGLGIGGRAFRNVHVARREVSLKLVMGTNVEVVKAEERARAMKAKGEKRA